MVEEKLVELYKNKENRMANLLSILSFSLTEEGSLTESLEEKVLAMAHSLGIMGENAVADTTAVMNLNKAIHIMLEKYIEENANSAGSYTH